jgi:hypothetical protein
MSQKTGLSLITAVQSEMIHAFSLMYFLLCVLYVLVFACSRLRLQAGTLINDLTVVVVAAIGIRIILYRLIFPQKRTLWIISV